ncbi:hypothetical protein Aph01nite_75670 [Acrocarpospora phusangensis]|uniref:Uncharacterized protein n=1 Tax=Acrocarpospora phusangensis TaxID=1070424 RepID=A0A919QHW8_9ACTN|nr:hypothetical protein Aph01nite_75670 [Acrocarpospora phusangensis]
MKVGSWARSSPATTLTWQGWLVSTQMVAVEPSACRNSGPITRSATPKEYRRGTSPAHPDHEHDTLQIGEQGDLFRRLGIFPSGSGPGLDHR